MIYLFVYISCLLADIAKKQSKLLYYGLVLFIIFILCFGYTCGSDWRNYELMYNDHTRLEKYGEHEFGFYFIVKLFQYLTSDFWIFNGITKIFFIYSLKKLFSNFTDYAWTCVSISFAFKTLFLVIDCPMRFMMGMSILFFAVPFFLRKKWIRFAIISFIAATFHSSMIIVSLLLLLLLFSDYIIGIKIRYILYVSVGSLALSMYSPFYQFLFDKFLFVVADSAGDNRVLFYAIFKNGTSLSFETLWHFILLLLILYNRKLILQNKFGKYIYSGSILYFCITVLVNPIPTSFRLTILMGYFFVVALVFILQRPLTRYKRYTNLINVSIVCGIMLIVTKDVYSLPAYYPYTNSVWYILTGHEPYGYRTKYNYEQYQKTFGKLPEKGNQGDNLNQ